MALLRRHSFTASPFRKSVVAKVSGATHPVRVLRPAGPLHWTPTLALSISISFPSQYVSRWRPMQDRCFNIGSALTYNNYRSVLPPSISTARAHPPALRSPSPRLARRRRRRFCAFVGGRLVGVGGRIRDLFLALMKVALSPIRNWSSLFNSASIGHPPPGTPGRRRGDAPAHGGGDGDGRAGLRPEAFSLAAFIACWRTFTGASSRS